METQAEIVRRPSRSPLMSSSPERAWLARAGYTPSAELPAESIRYLAMLRRHRKAVLLILAGCIMASLLISFFSDPTYKSRTLLEVMAVNQRFLNNEEIDPNTSIRTEDSYIETQMKLLTSDKVADRVVSTLAPKVNGYEHRELGGLARIRQWLQLSPASPDAPESVLSAIIKNMKVKPEGQSSLISVTVYGPTPELTADTANTVAKQYIDAIQEARWNTATQTGEFLSRQLDGLRTKLQASEDALQEYARQTGLVYTNSDRQSVAEEKLREIQLDLAGC
jgi:succinoglycan biosynthesis transport protein ExoP